MNKQHKVKFRFANPNFIAIWIIRFIDYIGYALSRKNRNCKKNSLENINSIGIVQLGHMGDLLLTVSFLSKIRQQFHGEIILIVDYGNIDIANRLTTVDRVLPVSHISFSRNQKNSLPSILSGFKAIKCDLLFELRGDLRILLPLYFLSTYKTLIGYDCGGGGFLTDIILPYPFCKHITDSYYTIFDCFDGNNAQQVDKNKMCGFLTHLNIHPKSENSIVIAIGSGAPSRDWPDEYYLELINMLESNAKKVTIVGIVTPNRLMFYKNLANCIILLNQTSFDEVASVIASAVLFIGLESGLTHLSTMLSVKTIAIYSATTPLKVWKPIRHNEDLVIIRAKVKCEECGVYKCKNNICMTNILPKYVFNIAKQLYKHDYISLKEYKTQLPKDIMINIEIRT